MGVKPTHERQVRSLAGLEPEEQRAAWNEAVKESDGKKPTAAKVKTAAAKRKPAKKKKDAPLTAVEPEFPPEVQCLFDVQSRVTKVFYDLSDQQQRDLLSMLQQLITGLTDKIGVHPVASQSGDAS